MVGYILTFIVLSFVLAFIIGFMSHAFFASPSPSTTPAKEASG